MKKKVNVVDDFAEKLMANDHLMWMRSAKIMCEHVCWTRREWSRKENI